MVTTPNKYTNQQQDVYIRLLNEKARIIQLADKENVFYLYSTNITSLNAVIYYLYYR